MTVRTFQAKTTSEALRHIKGEFGPDAVILDTRTLASGLVEVEASRGQLFSLPRSYEAPRAPVRAKRPMVQTATPPPIPDFQRDLEPVRELLRGFMREADVARRHGFPPIAAPTFLALTESGVPEGYARQLALDAAGEPNVFDELDVRRAARRLMTARTPCAGAVELEPGERRVVAVVGPTGVGKTTVLSKLAALAALRDGQRVGLISADASRLGAIDQVRRFATVLDVPFGVALTREGLRDALGAMREVDVVFVDTAGRSAKDEAELDALSALFEGPPCRIERHLVLAANAKERDNLLAVERFRSAGYQRVLFTKLDETDTYGGIYAAARAAKRPLSYLTRAPQIPEELHPASPEEIAELVLPMEGDTDVSAR